MRQRRRCPLLIALGASLLFGSRAEAAEPRALRVSPAGDGAATAAMLAGSWGLSRIHVYRNRRWRRELLWIDEPLRGRYSASAATHSDAALMLTIAGPLFAIGGGGLDADAADRYVVYSEAMAGTLLLTAASKYVVQRPRPYTYSMDPELARLADTDDAYVSFFSGHSSMSFAAAVAGSTLFATRTDDNAASAALWGVELALATTTAGLRVRAGKHYYSDVIVGALVGTGVGIAVPRLHAEPGEAYAPSAGEWGAIGAGLAVGTAAAALLPARHDVRVPLSRTTVQWLPMPVDGGAGVMAAGTLAL